MIAKDLDKKYFFKEISKEMGFTALKTGIATLDSPYSNDYINENFSLNMLIPKENKIKLYDAYMKKMIVCRECGRVIADYRFKNGGIYQTFTEFPDGQELIFTANDIIGVNKKFIGRYQEEYFCVPCLCKVLDITEERLHERINDFKEEGCALFF